MKRTVGIFIAFLFILIIFFLYRQKINKSSEFKFYQVKRGSIVKSISASGKVASEEEVELRFQTSGLLAWVGVKEGDKVNAWQAIAQLDTRELQKNLEKYLRDYLKERNDFEEDRQVTYKDQVITDTVKRILEKNQWDLEKAVLDVELKDLALKYATLITPISGIVTSIDTPVAGVNITPATAVFKIASPEKMVFKADIDEADMKGITTGLSAQIILDAYPDEKIESKISKIAFSSTTTSGGGTAFKAWLTMPENNELKYRLGMNGDAQIIISQKDNVLIIPQGAVFKRDDKFFVWQVKDDKIKRKEVVLGISNEDEIEVISGLEENDIVITNNLSKLKEGKKIKIKKE